MPKQFRRFFAHILLCCDLADPAALWERFRDSLSEDYFHNLGNRELATERTLVDLQRILESAGAGKRLQKHFKIPDPKGYDDKAFETKEMRCETLAYDVSDEWGKAEMQVKQMHASQLELYNAVMESIDSKKGGIFFADGPGGTGKTFVEEALLHKVRSRGEVALACAWSGVAATLLEGGRTCHATFGFPVPMPRENVGSSITAQQGRAKVLRAAALIIWDEAPMSPTEAVAGADALLRDICKSDLPFAGKTILFSGDFRQVLPVMPHTSRADIVAHSIKNHFAASERDVQIHRLKFNHRANQDAAFAEYLLRIGDGVEPTEPALSSMAVKLPETIVAPETWTTSDLLEEVFPDLVQRALLCAEPGGTNADTDFFKTRAVLSPKNMVINDINEEALRKMEAAGATITTYLSADTISDATPEDAMNYPQDFLHSLNPSGLPPHELRLTPGALVIMLRNIDASLGLVNGVRCIVKRCLPRFLDVLVLTGRAAGQRVYIPRIPMAPKLADLPFVLSRRQFPVRLAWAMTINKAQGQSLVKAGIALPEPVFAHGQLYVALSRVGSFNSVKVLIAQGTGQGVFSGDADIPDGAYTENVVWPEALLVHRDDESSVSENHDGLHMGGMGEEESGLAEHNTDKDSSANVQPSGMLPNNDDLAIEREHDFIIPKLLTKDGLAGLEQMVHAAHTVFEPTSVDPPPESSDADTESEDRMDTEDEEATATPAMPLAYPLLFETQRELRCGRHALTNVFGGEHTFTDADLSDACETLVQESFVPDDNGIVSDPQVRGDHERRNGWYSAAAIGMALRRTFLYELQFGHQLRFDLNTLEEVAVVGAIANIDNIHWVALKRIHGVTWLLDNVGRPTTLDARAFHAFVNKNPHTYVVRALSA